MKKKNQFKVGDIVHSKINPSVVAYEITKVNKTTCWVKPVEGLWIRPGLIYKEVRYHILKKGRRNES